MGIADRIRSLASLAAGRLRLALDAPRWKALADAALSDVLVASRQIRGLHAEVGGLQMELERARQARQFGSLWSVGEGGDDVLVCESGPSLGVWVRLSASAESRAVARVLTSDSDLWRRGVVEARVRRGEPPTLAESLAGREVTYEKVTARRRVLGV